MTEPEVLPPYDTPPVEADTKPVFATYIIYLVAVFTALPMFVGIIIAYVFRDNAPAWLATHYQYLIRTFWIMWVYIAIIIALHLVLIGFLLWPAIPIWVFIRCAIGLMTLLDKRPIARPASWLF